ncbi:aminodeoxychorismate lyase [Halothece sp. PCC 7418]|uniref:endolytic transglycosylase MltG n=1 Tax=Halothece sp. (strain PCC 7418) TaxID=65093 RepID=UPI0002A06755|nr:endolytic transglycosylase MltG [Halothece sp. PCC 7418]AFZ43839.1 aminodeoxychorismate lyase [Halothece sp. PCC 7418]
MLKKTFYGLFSFMVLLSAGGAGTWLWWKSAIAPISSNPSQPITITIPSGTAAQIIGQQLEAEGLIRSELAWKIWLYRLKLQEETSQLQAGTYQLSKQSSLPEIGNKIRRGETIQTRFTIPEGWTQREMADYFQELGYFSRSDFLAATRKIDRTQFSWLPDNLPHLEGFLYPDTYQIPRDRATPEFIIELMLNQFAKVALPLYETQNSPYTLQEWVTLASLVEKEAVVAEERSRIAAVFAKRLEKGMRLAADPTVEYGLNIEQTEETPLTLKQVNTPSPYNTYLNSGLPPTPIASPGKPALEASLNPPETEYLFFVARYDGTHVFSKTFAEHQAAQQRIQK